jgi:HSP20 family protein
MRQTLLRTEPIIDSDFMRMVENDLNSSFWRTMNMFSPNLGRWVPAVDIIENDNQIMFSIDIAGIPKENLNLEYEDNFLTISGERESLLDKEYSQDPNKIIHRHELRHGEFSRSFRLPEETTVEDIEAKYNSGLLEIMVSKHAYKEKYGQKIPIREKEKIQEIMPGETEGQVSREKEKIVVGT